MMLPRAGVEVETVMQDLGNFLGKGMSSHQVLEDFSLCYAQCGLVKFLCPFFLSWTFENILMFTEVWALMALVGSNEVCLLKCIRNKKYRKI